jgi:hypothetical protein
MNVLAALEQGEQLASLGNMETGDLPPGRLDQWRAEALLGELCSCLWSVFDVQLTLEQHLVKLSKLAHRTAYLFEGTGARTQVPARPTLPRHTGYGQERLLLPCQGTVKKRQM